MSSDEQPSTTTTKKLEWEDFNVLIREVKKRPVLWHKTQENTDPETCISRMNEWQAVATTLKKDVEDVKSRFRTLKELFRREEKKIILTTNDKGETSFQYTGHWIPFYKLLFLYSPNDQNTNDDIEDNDLLDLVFQTRNEESTGDLSGTEKEEHEKAEKYEIKKEDRVETEFTQTKNTNNMSTIDSDKDEDVYFIKSLVPYFKKLHPIKKLIVKNEMQNLLIKELICDHCRLNGLQPNCQCKLTN